MKLFGALCSLVVLAGTSGAALAGGPDYGKVQAALTPFTEKAGPVNPDDIARLKNSFKGPERAEAVPMAAVTAPAAFTLKATGSVTGAAAGACFDACSASAGHCVCYSMGGSANVSGLGKSTLNEAVTINIDDCLHTGDDGMCCPADGVASVGKGANSLAMVTQGQFCVGSIDGQPVDTLVAHMNFTILPPGGGKFAKSVGTGVIDKAILNKAGLPLWESATGMIQVKAP